MGIEQIQNKLIKIETNTTSNLRASTRNQENIQELERDIALLKIDITDIKEIVKRLEKNCQNRREE